MTYDAMETCNAETCLFLFLWKSVDQGCVHMMPVTGWRERLHLSDIHDYVHFSTPQRHCQTESGILHLKLRRGMQPS